MGSPFLIFLLWLTNWATLASSSLHDGLDHVRQHCHRPMTWWAVNSASSPASRKTLQDASHCSWLRRGPSSFGVAPSSAVAILAWWASMAELGEFVQPIHWAKAHKSGGKHVVGSAEHLEASTESAWWIAGSLWIVLPAPYTKSSSSAHPLGSSKWAPRISIFWKIPGVFFSSKAKQGKTRRFCVSRYSWASPAKASVLKPSTKRATVELGMACGRCVFLFI